MLILEIAAGVVLGALVLAGIAACVIAATAQQRAERKARYY